MKVAPVSGDLLVKLALGAVAVGLAVWTVRRATAAVSGALPSWDSFTAIPGQLWNHATDAAYAVAPWNQNNVVYQTANAATSAVLGREETLGGALYDLFNPDPMTVQPTAWQTAARWNNPSAYTAPSGQGGAAFGIYPRP